jgi:DNA-directed RNA polymerase subunit RPC12/RpoP
MMSKRDSLSTTHPELAMQASGWDPSTITSGSERVVLWRCAKAHIWEATVSSRVRGSSCPYCTGRIVLAGFNDLLTEFPLLAREAYGWDPTTVTPKSKKKRDWKCQQGHVWSAEIRSRAIIGAGCPFCDGRRAVRGVTDLATLHPSVAAQAYGWDPSVVNPNSHKKMNFICDHGHIVTQAIRRRVEATGCPVCQNDLIVAGINDLATTHPEIAAEADGWDPTTVTAGTNKKLDWKCAHNHTWTTGVFNRTRAGTGCPSCSGRIAVLGETDLATTHPEIAVEADGWDPTTVKAGTNQKLTWTCSRGHKWLASPSSRTGQGTGCPYCANKAVLAGYNDLATTHPEIAAEADGWDPTTVTAGNDVKQRWRCQHGHQWSAQTYSRAQLGTGCPYCSGRRVIVGETDLATTHPEIAAEADGWDPTTIGRGGGRKRWKCQAGHSYLAAVHNRTYMGSGCSICANKAVLAGYNDLATTHPEIAAEADGWDPTTVTAGSVTRVRWLCKQGHSWSTPVNYRLQSGCPYCANKAVLAGYNDLATTHPEIAAEADGWDPTTVTAGSNAKREWRCRDGHSWKSVVGSRTSGPRGGSGCPSCAKYGFNPSNPGWLYFLEHYDWGLFQIGITNDPNRRIAKHESKGWKIVDIRGPMDGSLARGLELSILNAVKERRAKMAPRTDIKRFDGWTEAWTKDSLWVSDIKQLLNWVYEDESK